MGYVRGREGERAGGGKGGRGREQERGREREKGRSKPKCVPCGALAAPRSQVYYQHTLFAAGYTHTQKLSAYKLLTNQ